MKPGFQSEISNNIRKENASFASYLRHVLLHIAISKKSDPAEINISIINEING